MTFSTIPSSFAPSLPSLPSYPQQHHHFAPSRSASPSPSHTFPQTKKQRPSFQTSSYSHSSYSHSRHRDFSFTQPPPPLTPDNTDSDDGLMTHSIYSDRDYRSSLVGSRKRGLADDDVDDPHYRPRRCDDDERGGGKRRIIDVVGGTLSGVLRGAWEMFRPRLPSFYSSAPPPEVVVVEKRNYEEPAATTVTRQRWDSPMPGQWGVDSPPSAPAMQQPHSFYDGSASTAPTEAGMSARWVMVSPTPPSASIASSSSSHHSKRTAMPSSPALRRHQRFVVAKKRGLKPPPRSPPCQSQAFTFGGSPAARPTSAGKKHRRVGSRAGLDDDAEMDDDMRRFNERLKAMIREGKEALGATVEVIYDEDDDMVGVGRF